MPQQTFNTNPILNSPYEAPKQHWKLDGAGLPTGEIEDGRRSSQILIPIPKATARRREQSQPLDLQKEEKAENPHIAFLRARLIEWRNTPIDRRGLSGATVRLLRHWSEGRVFPRPFFCQIEAIETFIWLNEVAFTSQRADIKETLKAIAEANAEANMSLNRLAAKMATGAGKTTVMAMLIAYHAINKSRAPNRQKYSDRFLIITPGITIKDRLRVLLPQDPDNYYEKNKIVPPEMLGEVKKAIVIITNYHAFKRRETLDLSKRQRQMLRGNRREEVDTTETEGQMLHRVCPEFLRRKAPVIVINDEAHHCYIHKREDDEAEIGAEEKEEAKRNSEAARLWINGIKALETKTPIKTVYDLSATPFFLRGSGYPEGTLFPWVVSDFSLMDAIESGIVKLPRVPVEDAATAELPIYRNLYQHISRKLPRSRRQAEDRDPQDLPSELMGALQALYSNYEKTHQAWREQGIDIPPVFIIVCNNTSTSKLVYDFISGYKAGGRWRAGEFSLFNNVKESRDGLLPRPRTILIDSYQLESGDAISDDFKQAAAAEIALFKEELRIRDNARDSSGVITDAELLREVMNTVGKKDKLGEQIRCVVSVSMLTEGWDTNNVTHILGVRAFGTQLLCEQVVGRGLRRYSYETEADGEHAGKFSPEYADVFGVPFNFAAGDGGPPPPPPKPQVRVRHLDERAHLEITFPRVRGYRVQPPETGLAANFTADSRLQITPDMAPPVTKQRGIVGEGMYMDLEHLKTRRKNEVVFSLAAYIARHYYKTKEGAIAPQRFRQLAPIVRHWMENYVECRHNTCAQYLLWQSVAQLAAERIHRACAPKENQRPLLLPVMDPFTPEGSTNYVDFLTRKKRLHETRADKSHINIAVCDSDWEMAFCKLLEDTDDVVAYVRNDGLSFEVPYTHDKTERVYLPDFIVQINDGGGDLLNLVIEVKGYRNGQAQAKADTMKKLWVPAVNNEGRWGRWAFEEIMDPQYMDTRLMPDHETPGKILAKYTRAAAEIIN